MTGNLFLSRRDEDHRRTRQPAALSCESLEERRLLNGSRLSAVLSAQRLRLAPTPAAVDTISGSVINNLTNRGVPRIQVQLINAAGATVGTSFTNLRGQYQFRVPANGSYVVREVTGKGFTQTSPSFASSAPVGAFAPGAGNSSWDYVSSNSNPANGPVGPLSWSAIAPAGDEPFESPVNITGATTDLGKILGINYNNTVPKAIIDNSHQIQVQFPGATGASPDSITVAGQVFNLSQFHFHDPAEDKIDGFTYQMEVHFVNTSASGAETVLAVFLQVGAFNPALQPVLDAASANLSQPNTTTSSDTTPINFAALLPSNLQGWYYQGSLTTPPLSQPINWFLFSSPITLSAAQLAQYQAVANSGGFLPNARPIQPTDGRIFNEVNYNVNFQGTSVPGLNFNVNPTTPSGRFGLRRIRA